MFGAQAGVTCLRGADFWSADGAFKVAPSPWAQLYTVRASVVGYVLPRSFAPPPPNKTGGTYACMWRRIKALVWNVGDVAHRLIPVDFEMASINATHEMFPPARIGGRYFHLAQSLCRRVRMIGLQWKCELGEAFHLRVKMLPSIAFHPMI